MEGKVMAQGSKSVGRDVPVSKESNDSAVPGNYHEYSTTNTKQHGGVYDKRQGAISAALGGKDSAKG